jgi:hypothetical protein
MTAKKVKVVGHKSSVKKSKADTALLSSNLFDKDTWEKYLKLHPDERFSDNLRDALKPLYEFSHKIEEFLQSEYKRKLLPQAFVGEAVMFELLKQSYGIPEYSVQEKLNRLLSVIQKALENYDNTPCSLNNTSVFDSIWERPDDPHCLDTIEPDISEIRLRKIIEEQTGIKNPDLTGLNSAIEKTQTVLENLNKVGLKKVKKSK